MKLAGRRVQPRAVFRRPRALLGDTDGAASAVDPAKSDSGHGGSLAANGEAVRSSSSRLVAGSRLMEKGGSIIATRSGTTYLNPGHQDTVRFKFHEASISKSYRSRCQVLN